MNENYVNSCKYSLQCFNGLYIMVIIYILVKNNVF